MYGRFQPEEKASKEIPVLDTKQNLSFKEYVEKNKKRNFIFFAIYQLTFHIGWLFKTESIIVPSAARMLGASNFIIGMFPMISILGEAIPPMFIVNWVKHFPRKKPYLLIFSFLSPLFWFLIFLSFFLLSSGNKETLLWCFITFYILFYFSQGAVHVLASIMKGKVIPYNIRGRLISLSGTLGGIGSIILTFFIVRPVLNSGALNPLTPYTILFLLSSVFFFFSWMSNFGIKEPPLESQGKNNKKLLSFIKESIAIIKKDRDFILFFFVGGTAMCGYSLLPFYTVYAKTHLLVYNYMLTYFLIVQVGASIIGSLFLGYLADKYGNRLVLRIIAMLLVLTPLSAVTIGTWVDLPFRQWLYCIVYFMVGFGLPVSQTLINYLLEISPLEKHPNYISIYNTFICVFFIFPLIIGFLMDHFYYNKVFLGISIYMVIGIVLTQKLVEPRRLLDSSEYQEELPLG